MREYNDATQTPFDQRVREERRGIGGKGGGAKGGGGSRGGDGVSSTAHPFGVRREGVKTHFEGFFRLGEYICIPESGGRGEKRGMNSTSGIFSAKAKAFGRRTPLEN